MPARRPVSKGAVPLAALLALVAGGCSTLIDVAGLPRGGPQPDGSYVLTEFEGGLDCRGLGERIDATLVEMKAHAQRIEVERRQLPRTVSGMLGRTLGGADGGLASAAKFRQGEARVRGLAAHAGRKNCADHAAPSLEARIADARSADALSANRAESPQHQPADAAAAAAPPPIQQTLFGAPVAMPVER